MLQLSSPNFVQGLALGLSVCNADVARLSGVVSAVATWRARLEIRQTCQPYAVKLHVLILTEHHVSGTMSYRLIALLYRSEPQRAGGFQRRGSAQLISIGSCKKRMPWAPATA
jgi:hypothetical protein